MKSITYYLLLFITICSLTGCTSDDGLKYPPIAPTEPIQSKALLDLSYGDDPDQVYDIYLPKNRTLETKVMILVHGGSWNSNQKVDIQTNRLIATK